MQQLLKQAGFAEGEDRPPDVSGGFSAEQQVDSAAVQEVLFIEVNETLLKPLSVLVRDQGCQARSVSTHLDALAVIAESPVQVVFVGTARGVEAALAGIQQYRAIRPLACVLIGEALVSEDIKPSSQEVLQAIRAGADDYVVPPFAPKELAQCLKYCREKVAQRQEMHGTIEALRRSEQQFQEFAEHLDQAFWLTDVDNQKCLYISPAYERIFGLSCESLMEDSYSYMPLVHDEDKAKLNSYIALRRRRQRAEAEYRIRRQDGSLRWIRSRAFPVRSESGEVIRLAGITEDITDKKHLEEELLHTQKMQAIGELAGGVAHDFNNLLTPILGYSDLLASGRITPEKTVKAGQTIRKAANRAMDLTKQLLGFARKGKHQHLPVNVHGELNEVIALVKRTFDRKITIATQLNADHAVVLGDPSQIHQVMLNLALNARDAMAEFENGKLLFETSVVDAPSTAAGAHLVHRGKYLMVAATDTGCGIERKIRPRIFEPFFSTKPHGEGSGMGLAMVYGIVRNHGGTIEVESEVGRGTTFRVYLPLAEKSLDYQAKVEPDKSPAMSSGLVLVVDDEESVREIARDMLEHLGCQVLLAEDGREGVAIYREHCKEISLVVLDMLMPRLGGHECFRKLKEINPDIKAVLSTGYDLDHSAQKILDEGVKGFIQKPYTLEQFADVTSRFLKS